MLLISSSQSISRGKVKLWHRISGVTIPNEKQVWVALTYVYGIGPKSSYDILASAKVEPTVRVKDLTDAEVSHIQEVINERFTVEGELQRIVTRAY